MYICICKYVYKLNYHLIQELLIKRCTISSAEVCACCVCLHMLFVCVCV